MDDDKIEKLFEQLRAAVMNRGLSDCPPKYLGGSRSAELEALCRSEPEWACSQIMNLRAELETVKKERDEALAEVETRLMMDGCPQCDHPMF